MRFVFENLYIRDFFATTTPTGIICRTPEQVETVLRCFVKLGQLWRSGTPYDDSRLTTKLREKTRYSPVCLLNEHTWATVGEDNVLRGFRLFDFDKVDWDA